MKITITVKKFLSQLGEKRVKMSVTTNNGITNLIFDNMGGLLLALRKIKDGKFVEGEAGFSSETSFSADSDIEIGEMISDVVNLYKEVMKNKEEWVNSEIIQKEFEI